MDFVDEGGEEKVVRMRFWSGDGWERSDGLVRDGGREADCGAGSSRRRRRYRERSCVGWGAAIMNCD